MRNFPVNVDGKEYWISRSVAVVGFVFRKDEQGNTLVLAVKRGKGCPDHVGEWCCPCGYLDYNETLEQAVQREIFEETGINVSSMDIDMVGINDTPEGRQNVTVRFVADVNSYRPDNLTTSKEFCEPDEVDEIMWIPVAKISEFIWAFGHKELILKYSSMV